MTEDQAHLKEECQQNLSYIDQTIESMRRLSRGSNPPALEPFGLSIALRRLIQDFIKH